MNKPTDWATRGNPAGRLGLCACALRGFEQFPPALASLLRFVKGAAAWRLLGIPAALGVVAAAECFKNGNENHTPHLLRARRPPGL